MIEEATTDGTTLWINTEIGCVFRMKCDGVFLPTTEPIIVDVNINGLENNAAIEVVQLMEGNREFMANFEVVISHKGVFEAVSMPQSKYWYVEFREASDDGFEEKSVCIARHPNDWLKCMREYMEGMKSEGLPYSAFEIINSRPIQEEEYQRFIVGGRK